MDEQDPLSRGRRLSRIVYRITRVRDDRWVVQRPDSDVTRVFGSPALAEAFVRHECAGSSATVELRIGDVYMATRLDAECPALFRRPR